MNVHAEFSQNILRVTVDHQQVGWAEVVSQNRWRMNASGKLYSFRASSLAQALRQAGKIAVRVVKERQAEEAARYERALAKNRLDAETFLKDSVLPCNVIDLLQGDGTVQPSGQSLYEAFPYWIREWVCQHLTEGLYFDEAPEQILGMEVRHVAAS